MLTVFIISSLWIYVYTNYPKLPPLCKHLSGHWSWQKISWILPIKIMRFTLYKSPRKRNVAAFMALLSLIWVGWWNMHHKTLSIKSQAKLFSIYLIFTHEAHAIALTILGNSLIEGFCCALFSVVISSLLMDLHDACTFIVHGWYPSTGQSLENHIIVQHSWRIWRKLTDTIPN